MTLTPRQRQVVKLVSDGLTYAQIGAKLGIAPETVRVHVQDIADRYGVHRSPLRWLVANAERLLAA